MSTGNWLNNDGLLVNYGVTKAIPEVGGDYLVYGDTREIELLVNLGQTQFGSGVYNPTLPPIPSTFQGTYASWTVAANAGLLSLTNFMPLQQTAPLSAPVSTSGGLLQIVNPQIVIDQVDVQVLIAANAGTGGTPPTGLTGIGLVVEVPGTPGSYAQVTPNAGVQIMGALTQTQLAVVGAHYIYLSDGTSIGTGSAPTAGSWLTAAGKGQQIPLVTNAITPLPVSAYFASVCAGTQYIANSVGSNPTGGTPGGLFKLRVRYGIYGNINQ